MEGIVGIWVNSPKSARHGDAFGYIRIWTTPSKKLVSWDDASSPTQKMIVPTQSDHVQIWNYCIEKQVHDAFDRKKLNNG